MFPFIEAALVESAERYKVARHILRRNHCHARSTGHEAPEEAGAAAEAEAEAGPPPEAEVGPSRSQSQSRRDLELKSELDAALSALGEDESAKVGELDALRHVHQKTMRHRAVDSIMARQPTRRDRHDSGGSTCSARRSVGLVLVVLVLVVVGARQAATLCV